MVQYNTESNDRRQSDRQRACAADSFCGMTAAEQPYVNESGWWQVDGAFNADGTPISAAA